MVSLLIGGVFGGLLDGAASNASKAETLPTSSQCSRLTPAQISKIVRVTVQPIAVATGCAWGSRLDDPTTTLVTIETKNGHRAHETKYTTSVEQSRVVYGTAADASSKPATALWVAAGQPITQGKSAVTAQMNTHVVVATKALKVSDERARTMALAVAAATNAPAPGPSPTNSTG